MKKLHLAESFRKGTDPRVRYYCGIRERYLGKKGVQILSPKTDFDYDGMIVDEEISRRPTSQVGEQR